MIGGARLFPSARSQLAGADMGNGSAFGGSPCGAAEPRKLSADEDGSVR